MNLVQYLVFLTHINIVHNIALCNDIPCKFLACIFMIHSSRILVLSYRHWQKCFGSQKHTRDGQKSSRWELTNTYKPSEGSPVEKPLKFISHTVGLRSPCSGCWVVPQNTTHSRAAFPRSMSRRRDPELWPAHRS